MHVAPAKAAKLCALRLPNGLMLGSLWHFLKLQLFGEKNRHPLECGILGTLRQKWGVKREYIYYISITYSKAAKLGILSWHPLVLGILSKTPLFPLRLPNCLKAAKLSHATTSKSQKIFAPRSRAARPGSPAREALPPPSSPEALATVSVSAADIHPNEPFGTCTKKGKRQTERFTHRWIAGNEAQAS